MNSLEDELLMYPRGKHDDLLDGLYYALKGAYRPYASDYDGEKKKISNNATGTYDWMVL